MDEVQHISFLKAQLSGEQKNTPMLNNPKLSINYKTLAYFVGVVDFYQNPIIDHPIAGVEKLSDMMLGLHIAKLLPVYSYQTFLALGGLVPS